MQADLKSSKNSPLPMKFSPLVDRITGEGSDAWQIHYAARAAQERGENVILLSVGDPDLDTPIEVTEQAIAKLRAGDTHYTPASGRDTLRSAIAALHYSRSGQRVGVDNVIFLAGAQNALFTASLCLAGPGDEVIALEPLYPSYPAMLEVSGAHMVRVASSAARGFRLELADLEAAITTRTRAIFFATPNNPSGVVFSEADMLGIAQLAVRHSLWVVCDEVYAGLAPQGRVPSIAATLPEQVVTVSSLSKSHAMPGWRAGWMVGPKSLIAHAEALAMCMLFGLPGFVQEAAITALQVAPAAESRIREYCAKRRNLLIATLKDLPKLRFNAPDAGMFILIDVSATGLSGQNFARQLFAAEGVAVLDGGAFGASTQDFVRVCFATDETSLREACTRIRRFVNSLGTA